MSYNPWTWLQDIKTAFQLMGAVVKGKYKMPWGTFFWIVLCAVYFISPIDALPDFLPILGFADDGAFLIFVLLLVHKDLEAFRQYQLQKKTILEAEIVEDTKHDQKTH